MTLKVVERQTCSSCLYWNGPTLECRLYPPPPRLYNENLKTFKKHYPPITDGDYWCGQHSFFADTVVEDLNESGD